MKLTYSNVTATLALFVALGGTSWAATQLARNSVGTAQLRAGSVTGAKVRDGSLTARDFTTGALARGPRGAAGPAGSSGVAGPAGPPGPSNGYVVNAANRGMSTSAGVTVVGAQIPNLPAGDYVITGSAVIQSHDHAGFYGSCQLKVNGEAITDPHQAVIGNGAGSTRAAMVSPLAAASLPAPSRLTLECLTDQSLNPAPTLRHPRLAAIRVDSVVISSG